MCHHSGQDHGHGSRLPLPFVGPWANHVTSPCLSLPICKEGIMIVLPHQAVGRVNEVTSESSSGWGRAFEKCWGEAYICEVLLIPRGSGFPGHGPGGRPFTGPSQPSNPDKSPGSLTPPCLGLLCCGSFWSMCCPGGEASLYPRAPAPSLPGGTSRDPARLLQHQAPGRCPGSTPPAPLCR